MGLLVLDHALYLRWWVVHGRLGTALGRVERKINLTDSVREKIDDEQNYPKPAGVGVGRDYLHREGDLAAIPSIIRPPPEARVALPLREDKRGVETVPSDAALVFRKGWERGEKFVFALKNATERSILDGLCRGFRLTPAHSRGRRPIGASGRFAERTALLGGSTTRQVALARVEARTGRAKP